MLYPQNGDRIVATYTETSLTSPQLCIRTDFGDVEDGRSALSLEDAEDVDLRGVERVDVGPASVGERALDSCVQHVAGLMDQLFGAQWTPSGRHRARVRRHRPLHLDHQQDEYTRHGSRDTRHRCAVLQQLTG